MGDKIIIIDDDEPKPAPEVVVIPVESREPKVEKVISEKTTVIEHRKE